MHIIDYRSVLCQVTNTRHRRGLLYVLPASTATGSRLTAALSSHLRRVAIIFILPTIAHGVTGTNPANCHSLFAFVTFHAYIAYCS